MPEDLSILGFGNERLDHVRHDLSTFQQHPIKIGQAAAMLDLDRINDQEQDDIKSILIRPDLLIRGTTQKSSSARQTGAELAQLSSTPSSQQLHKKCPQ